MRSTAAFAALLGLTGSVLAALGAAAMLMSDGLTGATGRFELGEWFGQRRFLAWADLARLALACSAGAVAGVAVAQMGRRRWATAVFVLSGISSGVVTFWFLSSVSHESAVLARLWLYGMVPLVWLSLASAPLLLAAGALLLAAPSPAARMPSLRQSRLYTTTPPLTDF